MCENDKFIGGGTEIIASCSECELKDYLIDLNLEMGSQRPSPPQIQTRSTGRPQPVQLSSGLFSDLDRMTPAEDRPAEANFLSAALKLRRLSSTLPRLHVKKSVGEDGGFTQTCSPSDSGNNTVHVPVCFPLRF